MCIRFLNILENVLSVQHVDMVVDKNVNVHDVALSGNKNACYFVLELNYMLVTFKKEKKNANLTHLLVLAIEPPLVQ